MRIILNIYGLNASFLAFPFPPKFTNAIIHHHWILCMRYYKKKVFCGFASFSAVVSLILNNYGVASDKVFTEIYSVFYYLPP